MFNITKVYWPPTGHAHVFMIKRKTSKAYPPPAQKKIRVSLFSFIFSNIGRMNLGEKKQNTKLWIYYQRGLRSVAMTFPLSLQKRMSKAMF